MSVLCRRLSVGILKSRPLEQARELLGTRGPRQTDVHRDDASDDQLRERLLHRDHSLRGSGLHHRIDLLDLSLTDQVADGIVRKQDLERRDTSAAVRGG